MDGQITFNETQSFLQEIFRTNMDQKIEKMTENYKENVSHLKIDYKKLHSFQSNFAQELSIDNVIDAIRISEFNKKDYLSQKDEWNKKMDKYYFKCYSCGS